MTRDEFLDGLLRRSSIPLSARTPTGFCVEGRDYVALPCTCSYEFCEGWAKVLNNPEDIAIHNRVFAPPLEEIRRIPEV